MIKKILILLLLFLCELFANDGVESVQRSSAYFLNKGVTSTTSEPTSLQFYEFRENLPDEISIDIYKNKDMSALQGKTIFVGYGVADPTGDDCKIFTPEITGQDNNITVCLPWWRVEREYAIDQEAGSGAGFASFIATMQRPRPPKNVSVCDAWEASRQLPGGTVTCTTYYDKTISQECFNNPIQAQCKKDNCGTWVKENCERKGRSLGYENESLFNVEISSATPQIYESRVNLTTEQFECPSGSFTNFANCTEETVVAMNPYECKPDDPSTPLDDSIMKYCDETNPVRDVATGNITGFVGTCPAEASENGQPFQITCSVDSFRQTRNICVEQGSSMSNVTSSIVDQSYDLHYTTHEVSVLTGAVDIYASRDDCVRANSIIESRSESAYINASGSGYLDDDIYLTVHHADDTHAVVYCNQQHNSNAGSKLNFSEMGGIVQCIPNDGHYSFNQAVSIIPGDIISIQQATEYEDSGYNYMNGAFATRSHYSSSSVILDGVEVSPKAYPSDFSYHPTNEGHLKLWENTLGTLSIAFPYVGYYKLFFYTDSGELITSKDISAGDFNQLNTGYTFKQLFLADTITINPSLDISNNTTLCLKDDWVDYGGGVHGGKGSKNGGTCQEAANDGLYQKSKAIKRVVVKDMLTDTYTVIPLVYPLGYPNRVFISKLKLYENRKYFCFEEPVISTPY